MPGSLCQHGAMAPVMLLVSSRVTMVDTYHALLEYSAPAGDMLTATAYLPAMLLLLLSVLAEAAVLLSEQPVLCGLTELHRFFLYLLQSHNFAVSRCCVQDASSCLGLSMSMVFCRLILAGVHHPNS